MKKLFAIITAAAFLGMTLYTQVALADSATSTGSLQPATTVTGSAGTSPSSPQLPAVQDSHGLTVAAGTLPDSPFYWLSNFIQKLELALTFNSGQKVSLAEHQALQKLAVAEAMTQKGNDDLAQKALNDYSDKINQAEGLLAKIQNPGSGAAKALETELSQTSAANIPVLSSLLDKLPPQAAQRVALNIVRSLEKVITKADNKGGQPDQVQDQVDNKDKDIAQDKINVDDKALTALAMLEKMYGAPAQNATNSNRATTQTSVSGNTVLKAAGAMGEQNKSPIAKTREKGQQGTLMGSGHMSNQISESQSSRPTSTLQTKGLHRETDNQDSHEAKDDDLQPKRN